MSENETVDAVDDAVADGGFAPITSQADLDRIVQSRVARVEAKYADYDEMKSRMTEIEDASKSDLERALARAEAAEAEVAAVARKTMILEAASKFGVPADYVNLITGDDQESIEAAAEKVGSLAVAAAKADEAPSGDTPVKFFDPGQGGASPPEASEIKEAFARQLFQV